MAVLNYNDKTRKKCQATANRTKRMTVTSVIKRYNN